MVFQNLSSIGTDIHTYIFLDKELHIATKFVVCKPVVRTILLHGSETWTIYEKHGTVLEKFQLSILRQILSIKGQAFVPNTGMRERAG